MMRRVLYVADQSITLYDWNQGHLLGQLTFSDDAAGHQAFTQFLHNSPGLPIQLLINSNDEDIRIEPVPHVAARDQRLLVERLLNRHYRDEPYVYCRKQGRSRQGRRDDQFLIASLGPNPALKHWLSVIEQCQQPLAGLWSLPLLSHWLIATLPKQLPQVLLLTQDADHSLRQSLFQQGQLLLSRRSARPHPPQHQWVAQQVEHMHRFLTNQHILGFSDRLHIVHCLSEDTDALSDSATRQYHVLPLARLAAQLKLKPLKPLTLEHLYTALCARQPLHPCHYATAEQRQGFNSYRAKQQRLRLLSLLLSLGVLLSLALVINREAVMRQAQTQEQQTQLLQYRYHQAFDAWQDRLPYTDALQQLMAQIQQQQRQQAPLPTDVFGDLAQILQQPQYALIVLQQMQWKRYQGTERTSIEQLFSQGGIALAQQDAFEYDDTLGEVPPPMASAEPSLDLPIYITLNGELYYDHLDYAQTVQLIERFAHQLRQMPWAQAVLLQQIPVDIRPPSQFNDQHRGDRGRVPLEPQQRQFEIILKWSSPHATDP